MKKKSDIKDIYTCWCGVTLKRGTGLSQQDWDKDVENFMKGHHRFGSGDKDHGFMDNSS